MRAREPVTPPPPPSPRLRAATDAHNPQPRLSPPPVGRCPHPSQSRPIQPPSRPEKSGEGEWGEGQSSESPLAMLQCSWMSQLGLPAALGVRGGR